MAYKNRTVSLLALTVTVLLAVAVQVAVGRDIPTKNRNDDVDKKQPEWLLDHDGSLLIPGIGRVMVSPKYRHHFPNIGSIPLGGGSIGGGSVGGGSYIPGGDDTLIPNPGFEVPNPVGGANPSLP